MYHISYTKTRGAALRLENELMDPPAGDEPVWLTEARERLSDALDMYVKATDRYRAGERDR